MSDESGSTWSLLALAGVCSLCCLPLAVIGGGAVAGGAAAGVTAVGGVVTSIGGLLVVGLATAVPLLIVGLLLRRRAGQNQ